MLSIVFVVAFFVFVITSYSIHYTKLYEVSRGAKEGILIKNPAIIEQIKEIKYAVFDKTGTLTKGEISVSNTNIDEKYFKLLGSIENYSEHPISKAIVDS